MWIKTKDGRYFDAAGCAIVPNQARDTLTLQPHGAKAGFDIAAAADEAELLRLQNKVEAAIVDRHALLDLS